MMLENKKKKILILSVLLVAFSLSLCISNINQGTIDSPNKSLNLIENENQENLRTSEIDYYTDEELIKNGNFSAGTDNWYNSSQGQDISDVNSSISGGEANYEILGRQGSKQIILNSTVYSDWAPFNKTVNPLVPNQGYGVDSDGAYCGHNWDDGDADQTPIMYWRTNVSMYLDMSNYKITSASLEAIMNASVDPNIDVESDTDARGSGFPGSLNQRASYDFAQFFVETADMEVTKLNTYELAFNQTLTLGEEGPPTNYDIEGNIETKNEQAIIDSITNVLAVDPGHDNFTLILGIYIYCADNYNQRDYDYWDDLRIKYVNLTFTYEKLINYDTSVSWNQDVDPIDSSYNIDNATLNFQYKIDAGTWPISSPNSEFRIIINNNQLGETVKFSTTTNNFRPAKIDGFDVSSLISAGQYVNLSIRAYIADTFELDRIITISIDNVSLKIDYGIERIPDETEYQLFFDGIDKTQEKFIEVPWNEPVNLSLEYNNKSNGAFLSGAVVSINGSGISERIYHHGTNNYSIIINTTNFGLGNNYFTIDAYQKYYEAKSFDITIIVIERETYIDNIELNHTEATYIEYPSNQKLDITISYNDSLTNQFINGANVTLRSPEGGIIAEFDEQSVLKIYNLTIDTTVDLDVGFNTLIIYAKKVNFTFSQEDISISIDEIETELEVLLNSVNSISFEYHNYTIEDTINITAIYREKGTTNFLDSATVQTSGDYIDNLYPHPNPSFNQYNLSILTDNLGFGTKFLTISAKKENYTLAKVDLKINVIAINTSLELLVNGTSLKENDKYQAEIDWDINITVRYRESSEPFTHIDAATVELINRGQLMEIGSQYNITIKAEDLGQGFNVLSLYAEKEGYQLRDISFIIEIIEKSTTSLVILNGSERVDNTYELTIGEYVNITLYYNVSYAEIVELRGSGLTPINLTELYAGAHYYQIIINSENFTFGINTLTLYAYKTNYEQQTNTIRIKIIDKKTEVEVFLDGVKYLTNSTIVLDDVPIGKPIVILFNYTEEITKEYVKNATVQLIGENLILNMTALVSGEYSLTFDTNLLDLGVRFLSIYSSKTNYQSHTIDLRITISRINTKISTEDGENKIKVKVGETYTLKIKITNLDFGGRITNAEVSYQSDFVGEDLKEGELEETDDGIYEIKLEDLPEGTYTITITVSHENDNYDFKRYEITISVVREEEEVLLFQILTVVGITSAIGIGGYLFAYQRVLKYPKPIRIVRKFRHNLKKKNPGKGLDIPSRENSFRKAYEENLGKGFSLGKGKSSETKEITEKLVKKSSDTTSNNLPDNLK